MRALLKPVLDRLNPAKSMNRIEREPDQQGTLDQITKTLTLYHYPTCPYCMRVRKVIDELGLNIEMKDINRNRDARKELITGGGKPTVPCLRSRAGDDSTWLYESADIIQYLKKVSATA